MSTRNALSNLSRGALFSCCSVMLLVAALLIWGVVFGIQDMLNGRHNEVRDIATFVVAFVFFFPK